MFCFVLQVADQLVAKRQETTAKPLQEYICQKEKWPLDIFELVHLEAFRRAIKRLDIHKRINAIKYVFDWQNTGEQKQSFEASQASQEDREEQEVSKCPLQCGCIEMAQHFLRCTVLRNTHIMDRCCNSLHRWLGRQKTHKTLQHILLMAVLEWIDEKKVLPGQLEVPRELAKMGYSRSTRRAEADWLEQFLQR